LYEAFSKKEKAKRWLAEQKYKDSQREVLKDLLRLYNLYDIVKLPEDEFDQFIDFLNVDANFLKTASEIELVTFIKDKFEHYQAVKKEIPR
jgi:arsenate reductase-like glutaredoxin family protein